MNIRRLLPLALVVALLALSAVASAAFAAPSGKEIQVDVVDYQFNPKTITVNVGDTVVWTNNGKVAHTVTASDGSWDSGRLEPGKTFSHTFDKEGTVPYYCKPHGKPDGTGMAATVMVQASTGAQPAAQAPAATQAPAPAGGETPSLDAENQPIAGNSVTVHEVVAAQDGWMVIHTNTADNKPGPVIGHTEVKTGENYDVKVSLSQTPNPGDKLWPMLHIDAGQKGVYEFPGADTPVVVNGDTVMKQITVLPAGQQGAATPTALPNTGENDSSNLWILLLGAGITLLLGSAIFLAEANKRS